MKIMKIAVSVDSLMSYLSLTLCILSTRKFIFLLK